MTDGFLRAGAVVVLAVFLSMGCDSGGGGSSWAPADRAWYYEGEFLADPGLLARSDQVVILDVQAGVSVPEHTIPYQEEARGQYLFAVEADDPFVSRVEVLDSAGRLLGATERGDGGIFFDSLPGGYELRVYHEQSKVRPEGTVAFVRRQIQNQALLPAESSADTGDFPIDREYPAYVALRFTTGAYKGQYLAAVEGEVWEDLHGVDVRFMRAVPLDTGGDEFQKKGHLFSFKKDEDTVCNLGNPPPFAGNYKLYSYNGKNAAQFFYGMLFSCNWKWAPHCPASQDDFIETGWTVLPGFHPHTGDYFPVGVQDKGGGTFSPWAYAFYGQPCSQMYAAENGYLYYTEFAKSADADYFEIDPTFTFYKDGSVIDRLKLKKGQVALFEEEQYAGAAVVLNGSFSESTLIPLSGVKSLAFGLYTDTTVRFYSQTGFKGTGTTIGVDMPAGLDLAPGDMNSIEIFDSYKILVSSKECPNCNLAGVDLSAMDLDGADLAGANLKNANFHSASLKKANLSRSLLSGAKLANTNLSGASLLDASLNADSGLNLAAATLTGAYLKNVNCKGADLGGAEFTSASFHTNAPAYVQSGCAQDTSNPPFTKNCASAEHANMDGTRFNGAYLAGTDFSGATANAADFSGSVLTGAHFKNAHLDWDSGTGAGTSFTGAFIGGANFANATVEGATFENAYVNLSTNPNDYSEFFGIPGDHTQFPGFDDQYGSNPCVWFVYSSASVVPQTKSGNTCPDGSSGPCDDTAWNSPVISRDQSPWQNSQVADRPDWCLKVDFDW